MKRLVVPIVALALCLLALPAGAQQQGIIIQPAQPPMMEPVRPNAYGPGIHSDSTGRPFTYQPQQQFQQSPHPPVMGPVKRDAYGPGVHMDQFGRPVREVPR